MRVINKVDSILVFSCRSSLSRVFYKLAVLKHSRIFLKKGDGRALFKLQGFSLSLDCSENFFLGIFWNTSEQLFFKTPPDGCFCSWQSFGKIANYVEHFLISLNLSKSRVHSGILRALFRVSFGDFLIRLVIKRKHS